MPEFRKSIAALDQLEAGGSTAGGEGTKRPAGGASRLIERPVAAAQLAAAQAPRGDMAFGVAVAADGRRLRGDAMLGTFGWHQIAALAGPQQRPWRLEFVRLVAAAGSLVRS